METDVVEGRVVQSTLVFLHLGLDAADTPANALVTPVAILAPVHASALQYRVAAAAEADVVGRRVVPEQALVGLHTQLEGNKMAGGAVLCWGPVTIAAKHTEHRTEGVCCSWSKRQRRR